MIEFDLTESDYKILSSGCNIPIKSKCGNYSLSSRILMLLVHFTNGDVLKQLTITLSDETNKVQYDTSFNSTKGFNRNLIDELIKELISIYK